MGGKRNHKGFSFIGLFKYMILSGIIGWIIGLLIQFTPMLCASTGALLGGIYYCGLFDDVP